MADVSDRTWYISELKDRHKVMKELMQNAYSYAAVLERLRKLADLDVKLRISALNIDRNPELALRQIAALRAAFNRM